MYPPETNTHFKINTRPRQGGRRLPHHQGHDLPPMPTPEHPYPSHFQHQDEDNNDAPHRPLRQDQQHHPQQYPHPRDQELNHHHLPPQHGYPHPDNHESAAENIPDNQHHHQQQKHHPNPKHNPDRQRHERHQYPQHKTQGPRVPTPRKTSPISWFLAFCCTIFWVLIILAGLIVLIIFLIYHPQTPHFHISTFTLNSLYLDNGNLLNADILILANFNNSNRKATIDFSYLTIDLYYGKTRIGTQYIEPFFESNSVTTFVNIHMVTSQLHLPFSDIVRLAAQMQSNRLQFEIKGTFRTTSNLGSLMHYSYWLHSHCAAVVTNPPNGILLWKKCSTKR